MRYNYTHLNYYYVYLDYCLGIGVISVRYNYLNYLLCLFRLLLYLFRLLFRNRWLKWNTIMLIFRLLNETQLYLFRLLFRNGCDLSEIQLCLFRLLLYLFRLLFKCDLSETQAGRNLNFGGSENLIWESKDMNRDGWSEKLEGSMRYPVNNKYRIKISAEIRVPYKMELSFNELLLCYLLAFWIFDERPLPGFKLEKSKSWKSEGKT